jgi:hypothetical protein
MNLVQASAARGILYIHVHKNWFSQGRRRVTSYPMKTCQMVPVVTSHPRRGMEWAGMRVE